MADKQGKQTGGATQTVRVKYTAEGDSKASDKILTDIYDSQILKEVEKELFPDKPTDSTDYSKQKPIDLPILPPHEEFNANRWALRQAKRALVIIAAIMALFYGGKALLNKVLPPPPMPSIGDSRVALPKSNPHEALEDRELKMTLDEGRKQLASSNLQEGASNMAALAEKHPETVQGQKAMLTLAATYRYNLGRPEEAIQWYLKYLKYRPTGREAGETMIRLGSLYEELGRGPDALDIYHKIIEEYGEKSSFTAVAKQGLKRLGEAP